MPALPWIGISDDVSSTTDPPPLPDFLLCGLFGAGKFSS